VTTETFNPSDCPLTETPEHQRVTVTSSSPRRAKLRLLLRLCRVMNLLADLSELTTPVPSPTTVVVVDVVDSVATEEVVVVDEAVDVVASATVEAEVEDVVVDVVASPTVEVDEVEDVDVVLPVVVPEPVVSSPAKAAR
jgi:hypothetical protein